MAFRFITSKYKIFLSLFFTGGVLEYCAGHAFEPSCLDGQVVVMKSARYGHIQLGKCVDLDFGNFGCAVDQLKFLDKECSGLDKCSVIANDESMGADLPCASAFVRYLEASYSCQEGKFKLSQSISESVQFLLKKTDIHFSVL